MEEEKGHKIGRKNGEEQWWVVTADEKRGL